MPEHRHFTTRRGFIATLGFGAVSLYGAWAAFGAAPLPFGGDQGTVKPHADNHSGHVSGTMAEPERHGAGGHGGTPAMTPEAFRFEHSVFLQKYAHDDGGVSPHTFDPAHHRANDHAHADSGHGNGVEPIDLYVLATRFAYSPDLLHLRAGVPYRFRLMADDITHGGAIQLGSASRIIRLRPNTVTEQTITFTRPGAYLVYCTVYCGLGHDAMQGRIVVV